MIGGPREASGGLFRRVALIVGAVVVMVWLFVVVRPGPDRHGDFRRVSTVQEPYARATGAAEYIRARSRYEGMVHEPDLRPAIAAELGPFRDLVSGQVDVPTGEKSPHVVVPTRAARRARRAYEGAPPFIPHPLDPDVERTQDCAPCHEFGGYNPVLRTYAPRSPHPEQTNCLQCHVLPVADGQFAVSDWRYVEWPAYGEGGALPGAPPTIPHTLQLREHCLACHGGAAAAPDIRSSHPERFNCRQCHVPAEVGGTFSRPPLPETVR